MTIEPGKLPRGVRFIVFTSVDDGLSSAATATEKDILVAFEMERNRDHPRSSLLKGLQRELRRRRKLSASVPSEGTAS